MTYVVPKNVVVQLGDSDADTLCGLPCSYYLDYNNLTNVPANAGLPDYSTAATGSVMFVNSAGELEWGIQSIYIDGGSGATVFSAQERELNGGGA